MKCLRPLYVESVDFVCADVADQEWRAVRGNAVPFGPGTEETMNALQVDDRLKLVLAQLDTTEEGFTCQQRIEIDVFPVFRPRNEANLPNVFCPLRPFLGLKIEEHQFRLVVARNGGEEMAIGRPARTEQAVGARHS